VIQIDVQDIEILFDYGVERKILQRHIQKDTFTFFLREVIVCIFHKTHELKEFFFVSYEIIEYKNYILFKLKIF